MCQLKAPAESQEILRGSLTKPTATPNISASNSRRGRNSGQDSSHIRQASRCPKSSPNCVRMLMWSQRLLQVQPSCSHKIRKPNGAFCADRLSRHSGIVAVLWSLPPSWEASNGKLTLPSVYEHSRTNCDRLAFAVQVLALAQIGPTKCRAIADTTKTKRHGSGRRSSCLFRCLYTSGASAKPETL